MRVRLNKSSILKIVYTLLFELEKVNVTSVAQKTKFEFEF